MRLLAFSAILVAAGSFAASAGADKPRRGGKEEREAEAHHQKGLAFLEIGQFEDAIYEFTAAQQIAPQPKNTLHIAECQEAMGNLLSAISSYKHYLAEAENPPEALRKHVSELDAKFHVEKARKLTDDHEYAGALRELEEAQKAKPDPRRYYDMALALVEMGDNARAIEHYRRYLKEVPDAPDAGEVEGRIKVLSGERMAPPPEPPKPPPPPAAPPFYTSAGGWGLTVAAVALGGASAGLFGATLAAGGDAANATSEEAFLAAQGRGSLFNTLGIVTLVAAGVALVAGVILFAAHARPPEVAPPPPAPSTSAGGL
jgi:tetratricopeptide (TPR) repeat protein